MGHVSCTCYQLTFTALPIITELFGHMSSTRSAHKYLFICFTYQDYELECQKDEAYTASENHNEQDHIAAENIDYQMGVNNESKDGDTTNGCDNGSQYLLDSEELAEAMTLRDELLQSQTSNKNVNVKEEIDGKSKTSFEDNENHAGEDIIGWDSESQYLLDSQQMVEAMTLCDELLQSQSPDRNGAGLRKVDGKPCLSDYAYLGPESLKRDLEDCQALALDPATIDMDSAPDFRLSQLVSYAISLPLCFPAISFFAFIFHNCNTCHINFTGIWITGQFWSLRRDMVT